MIHRLLASAILLAPAALYSQATTPPPVAAPATPASATPGPDQLPDSPGTAATPPSPTGPTILFDTTMGRLTCKLFDKQAPVATANFIGLAEGTKDWTDPETGKTMHKKRFYDGTSFHRVIPSFMIQGGDHKGDGTGDAGYMFDNESAPNLNFDVAGRLAMGQRRP